MTNTPVIQSTKILCDGGLLLYPTDTLWGLGCDATNPQAVEKLLALKQRPAGKSLIVIVDSMAMLEHYVKQIPDIACSLVELADQPLTIIYPQATRLPDNVTAPDGSIAIRIVRNAFCEDLLRRFKKPLVSTSANIAGTPAPAFFQDITDNIKQGVDFVVPEIMDTNATRRPSSIIKLGLHGEVEVLRV